jgi:hypothetical protein
LTPSGGKLAAAEGPRNIVGRGNVTIKLLNDSTARLAGVLLMPGIGINLLSTATLLAQRIKNHQLVEEVNFYRKGEREFAARGSRGGKTSYLTWIQDENAQLNGTAREISEGQNEIANHTVEKAGKRTKKASKNRKNRLNKQRGVAVCEIL